MESFIKVQPNPKNVPEYSIEQSNYIKDLLGPDTEILHIRPLEWTDNKAKYPEHDYNSIFKLKFAGRTILFPGDVSPQLLNELLSNPLYHNELTDIDFLVASHHGTDAAGEISTFYITTPEMIMICSDPATKHQLPWDIASHLIFKPEKQEDVLVAEHPVSTITLLNNRSNFIVNVSQILIYLFSNLFRKFGLLSSKNIFISYFLLFNFLPHFTGIIKFFLTFFIFTADAFTDSVNTIVNFLPPSICITGCNCSALFI